MNSVRQTVVIMCKGQKGKCRVEVGVPPLRQKEVARVGHPAYVGGFESGALVLGDCSRPLGASRQAQWIWCSLCHWILCSSVAFCDILFSECQSLFMVQSLEQMA